METRGRGPRNVPRCAPGSNSAHDAVMYVYVRRGKEITPVIHAVNAYILQINNTRKRHNYTRLFYTPLHRRRAESGGPL